MATQYPNSGKLSGNKYKEAGDKKPDMHGEIIMERSALKKLLEETDEDGIVIKLSAWNMEGNYGPWMRLSWNNYKPKPQEQAPQKQYAKTPQQQADDDLDDSIPF
jgi:hypothetical protein